MKITKIIAAGALCGAMLCTGSALAFEDMPSGTMGAALEAAVENKLLNGYDDNTIKPYNNITRAEMAAIITRAMSIRHNSDTVFNDVSSGAWYADDVSKAVYMGAFEGDENNHFNPDNNITFQEAYAVLARVLQYTPRMHRGTIPVMTPAGDCIDSFSDKGELADWAQIYAKALVGNGGYTGIDGLLKPLAYVTRGEFAMIMDQLVSKYIDEPGTYTPDNTDFGNAAVIVRCGDVTIDGLKTTKNIILSYGVTSKTSIKNIVSSASVDVYGGIDETPVKDADGNISADEVIVSLYGDMYDVRILSPYTLFMFGTTNADPKTCMVTISDPDTSMPLLINSAD